MQKYFAGKSAWITALMLLSSVHAALAQVVSVSKLSCTPGSLTSGATATCTVTLNGAAPSGGMEISLSTNNSLLRLSGNSVTIPAANTSASFTATAGTVAGNQTVTVTATALHSVVLSWSPSKSNNIKNYTVYRGITTGGPYNPLTTLGQVTTYTDYNVQNGQNYYYVTTAISASGKESAYSGEASAAVPPGLSQTATLSLVAPTMSASLNSLACSPATLSSGSATTCTVTLSNTAPPGGIAVSLSSNAALLPVPAGSITVPAGSNSATFTATAGTLTTSQSATLTATLSGISRTAVITLSAAASGAIKSLTCTKLTLASYSIAWCTISLNKVAPAGGLTVTLSTNSKLLWIPASVPIPQGLPLAEFPVLSYSITQNQTATISASVNSSSASVSLGLTP